MSDKTSLDRSPVKANRSVARAISVLRALAGSSEAATVTDIAKRVGLPRATTFRLLLTLEEEGFVDRKDTHYSLGWDLGRIAGAVDPAAGLVARVRTTVEELAELLGETVTLSLRRGLYEWDLVLQSSPRSIAFAMTDMRGMRWPLHASATGKLLLAELERGQVLHAVGKELSRLTANTITDQEQLRAELDRVRDQGWAQTDEELEDGIVALSVPIRDNVGQMFAALSVVAPKHRMGSADVRQQHLRTLFDGAVRLRQQLITVPPAQE